MPEINYVDTLAYNLARILPDESRCVFYKVYCPSTKIICDLTAHLGEAYIAGTQAELAVIIDGVEDVKSVFIFSDAIDDSLSDLLHKIMSAYSYLWVFHVKRCVNADMITGNVSSNISFNLIKQRRSETTGDPVDYKLVVFKEIENRIYSDVLRAMTTT